MKIKFSQLKAILDLAKPEYRWITADSDGVAIWKTKPIVDEVGIWNYEDGIIWTDFDQLGWLPEIDFEGKSYSESIIEREI